ncbi:hypothetical protein B0H17DRAFT_1187528 [Mycena rosella]|uniref:Uncharacterized protein n=1 Tax=Mycena rosella TaxID=1033263 RepID=A0AAD7BYD2_MYCRO|nr:hypothetical protein B0H17DRAFT_1187528 [Mycena rosella]
MEGSNGGMMGLQLNDLGPPALIIVALVPKLGDAVSLKMLIRREDAQQVKKDARGWGAEKLGNVRFDPRSERAERRVLRVAAGVFSPDRAKSRANALDPMPYLYQRPSNEHQLYSAAYLPTLLPQATRGGYTPFQYLNFPSNFLRLGTKFLLFPAFLGAKTSV